MFESFSFSTSFGRKLGPKCGQTGLNIMCERTFLSLLVCFSKSIKIDLRFFKLKSDKIVSDKSVSEETVRNCKILSDKTIPDKIVQ